MQLAVNGKVIMDDDDPRVQDARALSRFAILALLALALCLMCHPSRSSGQASAPRAAPNATPIPLPPQLPRQQAASGERGMEPRLVQTEEERPPSTIVPLAIVFLTDGWEATISALLQRCLALDPQAELVGRQGTVTMENETRLTLLVGCKLPVKPNA